MHKRMWSHRPMWGRARSETGDWRLKIERLRVERLRVERLRHRPRHGHGHGTAVVFMGTSRVRTLRLRTPKHEGGSTEVYRMKKDGGKKARRQDRRLSFGVERLFYSWDTGWVGGTWPARVMGMRYPRSKPGQHGQSAHDHTRKYRASTRRPGRQAE